MKDEPKIVTPCPSCGARSLFIGAGGHLTCGVIGCKEPSVEAVIDRMKQEIRTDDALLAERDKVLDALLCPIHGRCVPHAMRMITRLKFPLLDAINEALKEAAEHV